MRKELFITSTDASQRLHCCIWEPVGRPVAILQIVHGMEEYIERYEPFALLMVQKGWAVIGHSHLGHGKSGYHERGHFSDSPLGPHLIINDIYLITKKAKELWSDTPLSIMGHSMGSFLVRRYLCEHSLEVSEAVIMGSGWYSSFETGIAYFSALFTCAIRGRHVKSQLLRSICSLPFLYAYKKEGRNAWLSVNRDNAESFTSDPLRGFGFTAGGYEYMYRNLYEVSRHLQFDNIRRDLPVLFISGENDRVGGEKAVRRLASDFRERGFTDISTHVVPGMRHEIFFEDNALETMSFVADWLG